MQLMLNNLNKLIEIMYIQNVKIAYDWSCLQNLLEY